MVPLHGQDSIGSRQVKSSACNTEPAHVITAHTPHQLCRERLTAFGGLLALIKFLEGLDFLKAFEEQYRRPVRRPLYGDARLLLGILGMLFSGFTRLGHIDYVRTDPMLCGWLKVSKLPAVSTFWRYVRSLGRPQAESLLRLMGVLRCRVWQACGLKLTKITVFMDSTTATVYGQIWGAKKCYNPRHRGAKGLRPLLCFIQETGEYLYGGQRRGQTVSGKESARVIRNLDGQIPSTVKRVLIRADAEFTSADALTACRQRHYDYIFAAKRLKVKIPKEGWYQAPDGHEYNETTYQASRWAQTERIVMMRLRKRHRQLHLDPADNYEYRMFATNLERPPHRVVAHYDSGATGEQWIGEAQREGLLAIPSKKFAANAVFFQLVMLSYNLWRWMLLHRRQQEPSATKKQKLAAIAPNQHLRVARLKTFFIGAKITSHSGRAKVHYSMHEARAVGLSGWLGHLDRWIRRRRDWNWLSRATARPKGRAVCKLIFAPRY